MSAPSNVSSTTSRSVISLPASQINLASVGRYVAEQWANKFSTFTTTFLTLTELQSICTRFHQAVSTKSALLGKRKILTKELNVLCSTMDKNSTFLKAYLKEEFGTESAKSYYTSFGLGTENKKSMLPSDRDKRILALQNIVNAMTTHTALGSRKYGLLYWTEQLNTLQAQWQIAKQTDSELSALTESIRTDYPILRAYLTKIKQQIKLNSGSTYKQSWRDWGFQTEKYK